MIHTGTRSGLHPLFALSVPLSWIILFDFGVMGYGQEGATTSTEATPAPAASAPATPPSGEAAPPAASAPAPVADPVAGDVVAEGEPRPSYTRLGDDAVADLLTLTDAQRAQVKALLAERATALAAAAEADKPSVIEQSEQKLAALLTEEQVTAWATVKPEPKLEFKFRYVPWVDVLTFVAEKAELSLTLDAPPPGTFNFSDSRKYTPTEAVDMLNGVLLNNGYALIRRGRMLMVVDLEGGIPDGMVPKVTIDELDSRGKFELVTCTFPLGRRPAAIVETEIKPLLNPYGTVVALPATAQVIVTDTAGVAKAIGGMIESITEPPAVASVPPVLQVYTISPADPELLKEAVTALAPSAKVVMDEAADQLHVHAVPSEHAMIKSVLETMQAGNPPRSRRRWRPIHLPRRLPRTSPRR